MNTVTVTTLLELTGHSEFNVLEETPQKRKYLKIKLENPTAKIMRSAQQYNSKSREKPAKSDSYFDYKLFCPAVYFV